MAESYSTYLQNGKDFEKAFLEIYKTSPELISQIKAESEKFKQITFETEQ